MRFKITFIILMLVSATAQNAINSEAAALLKKAKLAHGAAALEAMKSYREQNQVIFYQNDKPIVQLEVRILLDVPSGRFRQETLQAGKIVEIYQLDPQIAWRWTNASGITKMPVLQAKDQRDSLYRSWFGLRFKIEDRDAISVEGLLNIKGIKGQGVSVTTKGVKTTYVFNESGLIVAERYNSSILGTVASTYSNYRTINGIQIPFEGQVYAENTLLYAGKTLTASVNNSINSSEFAQPK